MMNFMWDGRTKPVEIHIIGLEEREEILEFSAVRV